MDSNLDYIWFDYTFQPNRSPRRRRAPDTPRSNLKNNNRPDREFSRWATPVIALLTLLFGSGVLRNQHPDPKVLPEVASANARFVEIDTTTKGNWRRGYGGDWFNTVNDGISYPSYAHVKVSGHSSPTWMQSTTDVRAPERIFGCDRVAARWESDSWFTVDIEITDGKPHRMALYAVDWDGNNRSQRIDVLDAATNSLLDSRSMASFNGGQYLVWELQGHVKIMVNRTGAKTAVVSGLYSKLIA
jgi:hypothetical protein